MENTNQRFERCARCKVARYCSKACQPAHWPDHTYECVKAGRKKKKKEMRHSAADHKALINVLIKDAARRVRAGDCVCKAA